jgi:hypothetical protein
LDNEGDKYGGRRSRSRSPKHPLHYPDASLGKVPLTHIFKRSLSAPAPQHRLSYPSGFPAAPNPVRRNHPLQQVTRAMDTPELVILLVIVTLMDPGRRMFDGIQFPSLYILPTIRSHILITSMTFFACQIINTCCHSKRKRTIGGSRTHKDIDIGGLDLPKRTRMRCTSHGGKVLSRWAIA